MNDTVSTVPRKGPPKPSDVLARIASNVEPHAMRDEFDIGETLTALAEKGEPVSAWPSGSGDALLARIESVDPDEPRFVFDFAGPLPPPGPVTFVASLGGNAKLQFDLDQQWIFMPGKPNLVPAEFPETCLVLNRRAARRLETPVGVDYTATFKILGKSYELPLYDYSQGGVGLRATPEQCMQLGLRVGKKVNEVRLQLGPALVLTADLEVRLLRPFRTFLLGDQVQVGCAFASISMQMQQSLERFLTRSGGERRSA